MFTKKPLTHPWTGETPGDKQAILDVLKRHEYSGSKAHYTKKVQSAWAEYLGVSHCILTSSGTAALHAAIANLNAQPGDEVIVPAFSFTSTSLSIVYENLKPVFCDIRPDTLNIDETKIEELITEKTKAILVVHINGTPAEMDAIMAIAQKHNLVVIEDACQAHGAEYKNKKVGTIGHMAAFSLNKHKNLPAGEGGFFVTNSNDYYKQAAMFCNIGVEGDPEVFVSQIKGYKYRATEFTAALAFNRLKKLDEWNKARGENKQLLIDQLQHPDITHFKPPTDTSPAHYWFTFLLSHNHIDNHGDLSKIVEKLRAHGVSAVKWQLFPLSQHPVYKNIVTDKTFDVAQDMIDRVVWIRFGINPPNTKKEVDNLSKTILEVISN